MTIPEFLLNNGVRIPAVGFGVFQTPPDETINAVTTALAWIFHGYGRGGLRLTGPRF